MLFFELSNCLVSNLFNFWRQLDDAELARASAAKAKQSMESELNEVSGQLEEALRAKGDAENRCQAAQRESNGLRTLVDENEEELAEVCQF